MNKQSKSSAQVHLTVDDEGWTHILQGDVEMERTHGESMGLAKAADGLTLEQIIKDYQVYVNRFKKSRHHAELTAIFENTILELDKLQVSSIICTGLGTFSGAHPYCDPNPAVSLYQLAALETMLEILGRTFEIKQVYLQDPVMNAIDEGLLHSRGFTVLHHPEAQNAMTPTTFLYTPGGEWHTIRESLLVHSPALYLGNPLEDYLDFIKVRTPDGKLLSKDALPDRCTEAFHEVYKPYADSRASTKLRLHPTKGRNSFKLKYTLYWPED